MINLKVLILTIYIVFFLLHPHLFFQIIESIKQSFKKKKYIPKKINLLGKIIEKKNLKRFTLYSWIILTIFVLVIVSPPVFLQDENDCNFNLLNNGFYKTCEDTIQKYKPNVVIIHGNEMVLNIDANTFITLYGSYDDLNTKKVAREIIELNQKNNNIIRYSFVNTKPTKFSKIASCIYFMDAEKFWAYHTYLMSYDYIDESTHEGIMNTLQINQTELNECLNGNLIEKEEAKDKELIESSNIFAIPTTFLNNNIVIGSQPISLPKN